MLYLILNYLEPDCRGLDGIGLVNGVTMTNILIRTLLSGIKCYIRALLLVNFLLAYGKSIKSQRNTLDISKKGGVRRSQEQKLRLFMKTAAATTAWLEEKVIDA